MLFNDVFSTLRLSEILPSDPFTCTCGVPRTQNSVLLSFEQKQNTALGLLIRTVKCETG